jgi:hypothetical protein
MIVQAEYEDGTRTVIYEPGDRVRLLKVPHHAAWLAKVGEIATVIRRDRPRVEGQPTSIDFLDIRTDAMAAGDWGTIHVAPWDIEIVEEAERQV